MEPSLDVEKYTTKKRVALYSGVNQNEIEDEVIQDAEDWVDAEMKKVKIDPDTVAMPNSNLRQAATWYAVYLLSQVGGGKKYIIHATPASSTSVGELSESRMSPQFTREEKPTSDWYGLAQRAMGSFITDLLDEQKVSTKRFIAKSASTTDRPAGDHIVTGREEYAYSTRMHNRSIRRRRF